VIKGRNIRKEILPDNELRPALSEKAFKIIQLHVWAPLAGWLQGIASAGIAAPAFALAADLSKPGGEGRQMSITTMGFGLGIALGPLIAGVLAVLSFHLPFVIGGLMSLVGAWVVHRYVIETVHPREKK
jgi:MFS family permease